MKQVHAVLICLILAPIIYVSLLFIMVRMHGPHGVLGSFVLTPLVLYILYSALKYKE